MTTPLLENDTIELNSKQVRNTAIEIVMSQFDMQINGYKYTQNEIWDTLLYASASNKTIRYTCMKLENAPSCNLLYTYMKDKALKDLSLDEIEKRCNGMIVSTLPSRLDNCQQKVAIDLVLIPLRVRRPRDPKTMETRIQKIYVVHRQRKARPNSSAMPVHT